MKMLNLKNLLVGVALAALVLAPASLTFAAPPNKPLPATPQPDAQAADLPVPNKPLPAEPTEAAAASPTKPLTEREQQRLAAAGAAKLVADFLNPKTRQEAADNIAQIKQDAGTLRNDGTKGTVKLSESGPALDSDAVAKALDTEMKKPANSKRIAAIAEAANAPVRQIARGADKNVLTKRGQPDSVFYVARPGKANALQKELDFQGAVQAEESARNLPKAKYLALDMKAVTDPDIKGKLVVKAPIYEKGDLAKVLRTQDLSADQRLDIARQVAEAVEELHARGFVHGDLKADNFLVGVQKDPATGKPLLDKNGRPKLQVVLSDFGKAEKLAPGEVANHMLKGNLRTAIGPEATLSHESENAGVGKIISDVLATGVQRAGDEPLVVVDPADKKGTALANRLPLETFLVESKGSIALDEPNLKAKLTKAIPVRIGLRLAGRSEEGRQAEEALKNRFDGIVIAELKTQSPELQLQYDKVGNLLRGLATADPTQRTKLSDVVNGLKDIATAATRIELPVNTRRAAANAANENLEKANAKLAELKAQNQTEEIRAQVKAQEQAVEKLVAQKQDADRNLAAAKKLPANEKARADYFTALSEFRALPADEQAKRTKPTRMDFFNPETSKMSEAVWNKFLDADRDVPKLENPPVTHEPRATGKNEDLAKRVGTETIKPRVKVQPVELTQAEKSLPKAEQEQILAEKRAKAQQDARDAQNKNLAAYQEEKARQKAEQQAQEAAEARLATEREAREALVKAHATAIATRSANEQAKKMSAEKLATMAESRDPILRTAAENATAERGRLAAERDAAVQTKALAEAKAELETASGRLASLGRGINNPSFADLQKQVADLQSKVRELEAPGAVQSARAKATARNAAAIDQKLSAAPKLTKAELQARLAEATRTRELAERVVMLEDLSGSKHLTQALQAQLTEAKAEQRLAATASKQPSLETNIAAFEDFRANAKPGSLRATELKEGSGEAAQLENELANLDDKEKTFAAADAAEVSGTKKAVAANGNQGALEEAHNMLGHIESRAQRLQNMIGSFEAFREDAAKKPGSLKAAYVNFIDRMSARREAAGKSPIKGSKAGLKIMRAELRLAQGRPAIDEDLNVAKARAAEEDLKQQLAEVEAGTESTGERQESAVRTAAENNSNASKDQPGNRGARALTSTEQEKLNAKIAAKIAKLEAVALKSGGNEKLAAVEVAKAALQNENSHKAATIGVGAEAQGGSVADNLSKRKAGVVAESDLTKLRSEIAADDKTKQEAGIAAHETTATDNKTLSAKLKAAVASLKGVAQRLLGQTASDQAAITNERKGRAGNPGEEVIDQAHHQSESTPKTNTK